MACAVVNPNIDASDVWPLCQGDPQCRVCLSPKSILPQCHHSVLHRPCPDHIASLHSPSLSFALGSISIQSYILSPHFYLLS